MSSISFAVDFCITIFHFLSSLQLYLFFVSESTNEVQPTKHVTLRTMAKDIGSDEESEDENAPDADFVDHVERMHTEGDLISWVKTSQDPAKNPLLQLSRNGEIRPADVAALAEEFTEFFKDMQRVQKKHGCFTFLNNFLSENYSSYMHEEFSLRLSQIQYLQIVILHYNS